MPGTTQNTGSLRPGTDANSDIPAALSPVEFIGTDDPTKPPRPGIALCLSGGGYRAMLFHVGALLRLNELGLLLSLDRVSSVSGGSITAALLDLTGVLGTK
jgi:NTE family protein